MATYAVFGVGVGNLGRGRSPRRPMSRWVAMLNSHLQQGEPSIRIAGSFGHTGNFWADSLSTDLDEVTARFGHLLETDWVVRPINDVRAALTALADVPEPQGENEVRWTPGLAFHAGAGIACGSIATTSRAVLWWISPCTIGAWKRDKLGADETLDRDRRGGGWGRISADIEHQLGGRWTARSRRTVAGLARNARTTEQHGAGPPV